MEGIYPYSFLLDIMCESGLRLILVNKKGIKVPLTQLLSPSVPTYYGVIFLREERPLAPEVLTHWAETLSQPLFGQPFSCTLAQVPSRQEAMEQFENEMRLTR